MAADAPGGGLALLFSAMQENGIVSPTAARQPSSRRDPPQNDDLVPRAAKRQRVGGQRGTSWSPSDTVANRGGCAGRARCGMGVAQNPLCAALERASLRELRCCALCGVCSCALCGGSVLTCPVCAGSGLGSARGGRWWRGTRAEHAPDTCVRRRSAKCEGHASRVKSLTLRPFPAYPPTTPPPCDVSPTLVCLAASGDAPAQDAVETPTSASGSGRRRAAGNRLCFQPLGKTLKSSRVRPESRLK